MLRFSIFLLVFFLAAPPRTLAGDLLCEELRVCKGETCFSRSSDVAPLTLSGIAHFRYWGFRVYSAALYTAPGRAVSLGDVGVAEMELRLTYYRELTPKDFISSGESLMKDNPEVAFNEIREQSNQMNALYKKVERGDTYSIHFKPGVGTALLLNGALLGVVPGDAFGKAYLGVWLSTSSISEDFTEDLLDSDRIAYKSASRAS